MTAKFNFTKSSAAGALITLAAYLYLRLLPSSPIIAAVLFSAGLFFILLNHLQLFTGVCGYPYSASYICLVFIGNAVGCMITSGLLYCIPSSFQLTDIMANKIGQLTLTTIISWASNGFFCGVLMFLAVNGWKHNIEHHPFIAYLSVLYAIPCFILSGFEHSIADIAYVFLNRSSSLESLGFIVVIACSNVIGGKAAYYCFKEDHDDLPNQS